jgi:hypothetical protein
LIISDTTNNENAIVVIASLRVLILAYAYAVDIVRNVARDMPMMCREICAMCNPWKMFGIIIGKNSIPITASMLTANMLLLCSMNPVSDN